MTAAERLRQIADTLRTAVAEGDFDECDAHVGTDMEALPAALEAVAFALATPTEPPHMQARQMCRWLNVWCERQAFTAEQRFQLRTLVGHLDGLARRLEAEHMARAKPRRLGWACRVRNWWRAV